MGARKNTRWPRPAGHSSPKTPSCSVVSSNAAGERRARGESSATRNASTGLLAPGLAFGEAAAALCWTLLGRRVAELVRASSNVRSLAAAAATGTPDTSSRGTLGQQSIGFGAWDSGFQVTLNPKRCKGGGAR
jgi:hypothetical protein